jgi:hypothetical protein
MRAVEESLVKFGPHYPARLESFDADTSGMVEKMMSPTAR